MYKDLRCISDHRSSWHHDTENVLTITSMEQIDVERSVEMIYENLIHYLDIQYREDNNKIPGSLKLKRRLLEPFLEKGLTKLSESYACLDASRPWICYWVLHSMELLQVDPDAELKSQIVEFLSLCQDETGGFAGGPGQLPHLAPTYAAVSALCIIGTEEAYSVINRKTMYNFLLRMHQSDGSFIMHTDGEVDIRGCYLAACVARLLNILSEELFDNTAPWVASCQTYEGGFGGVPGMEAHGGYAFCGIAALTLLGHEKLCDLDALLLWAVNRQMRFEGGFQGRTNKLVDSCYSYWQSAIIPVISTVSGYSSSNQLFHNGALQEYLLLCCQHYSGGFIDKPGKSRDYYHTCYSLSGLSISQHFTGPSKAPHVIGPQENMLVPLHPVYNLGIKSALEAIEYFTKQPNVSSL